MATLASIHRLRKRTVDETDSEVKVELQERLARERRSFRRRRWHRLDGARVTTAWLWLLLECRRKGWSGHLNGPLCGVRTFNEQALLFARARAGLGAPAYSPRSRSARHLWRNIKHRRWRMAADVSEAAELIRIARTLGVKLYRPYPHEPWHVEAAEEFEVPVKWPK